MAPRRIVTSRSPRSTLIGCIAAAALGSAASAGAAPPLVGQWPLDSSHVVAGSDVTDDVSGNGLALKAASGAMHFASTGGKFGSYLSSATTTTLKVDSPLIAPPQMTLLVWIKQSGSPGNLKYIAGRGDDGFTCGGSSFALYTGYAALPGLHFYARSPGPYAPTDAPPDATVFDGQWHLVAGTFDGADIRLFVDGNQVGPAKPLPGGVDYALSGGTSFYVDGYPVVCDPSDWPGPIDEVRLYDRALSSTELARLAAAPGPGAPDLVPDEEPPGPPPPPPPPPPAVPTDHQLLGQVTYEPAFGVGNDADSVLSPFVIRPEPRGLSVTLTDAAGAVVVSRQVGGGDTTAGRFSALLYRFDALGACSGCTLLLTDSTGVQDQLPVSFDGEAGQTSADLVYGRARTGGIVNGGVLVPSSIRASALKVVLRGADGAQPADTAKLPSCRRTATGSSVCRAADRYGYRITGLPLAAVPVVAELGQQTPKGRYVVVDSAAFTLDATGATAAPDLTALADVPPDGNGRVLYGQLNAVAPFAPGGKERSQLDAPERLLRDTLVELRAADGALVKRIGGGFKDDSKSGFTRYTMTGLQECANCTMRLLRKGKLVDTVPVTVPARAPSVTRADLDFRDGTPAFVDGIVQTGTRSDPGLVVAALDPLTGAVLAGTPQREGKCPSCASAARLPYRLGRAPAGQTVLLVLLSRSTTLDSRLIQLAPEGQVTQAPVLTVPRRGAGRVLQGDVFPAGPFGPGLQPAGVGKVQLRVVLRGADGTELGRTVVDRGKLPGYALSDLAPCADCTVELLDGTTLEDRAAVTIRPEAAAVTVADLGAGAISGGAYVQGALVPRRGESPRGVSVQVRGAGGKVLADTARVHDDTPRAGTAARPTYRLGGIPRDAGTVTVVVLSGKLKLASTKVTIPVGAGDVVAQDLKIDVPGAGGRG